MIMVDKMDIWQSLGPQGNHHTLPDQSSSYSTIVSNEIASFPPPSFSVMGLVQGKASEILLLLTHRCHEMIYFEPQMTCFGADGDQWMMFIGGPFYCSFI